MGRSGVSFSGVYAGRLSGFKDKLVRCFKLAADMVRSDIEEFMFNAYESAVLKKELV